MKKKLLLLIAFLLLIIAITVYVSSCGGSGSACEDLLHRACDCLYPDNATQREECHSKIDEEVSKSPFTADEDSKCQNYIDSCSCDAMKKNDKNACGDILDSI